MTIDVVDVVRRNMDAWNSGDVEAFAAIAHPEAEWHPASTSALSGEQVSYVGPDGLRRWWHEMRDAFEGSAS